MADELGVKECTTWLDLGFAVMVGAFVGLALGMGISMIAIWAQYVPR